MSSGTIQHATRIWNDEQQTTPQPNDLLHHLEPRSRPLGAPKETSPSRVPRPPQLLPMTGPSDHYSSKSSKSRASRPTSNFHPYKSQQSSPPPSPTRLQLLPVPPVSSTQPPSRPIQFIDATFQPGDGTVSMSSSGGFGQCRPKRKKITQDQLTKLLEIFETTDNPGFEVRDTVGNEIGMSNREVQVWFQNRRAKVTREKASALAKTTVSKAPLLSGDALPSGLPSTSHDSPPPSTTSLPAGQHQWRFSNPPPSRQSPGHHQGYGFYEQQLAASPSLDTIPHYRKRFGDQRILLPRSSSPLPSPEVSSNASESSSCYFTHSLTPPLSYTATTPGAESPGWTSHSLPVLASTSGRVGEPRSPHFGLPFGSPSVSFDRLALRSPPIYPSSGIEREPFFFAAEMPSPTLSSEPEEFIRLAPIRGMFDPATTPKSSASFDTLRRRRSLSNPEAARFAEGRPTRPAHRRLPSIRDLLNPVVAESPLGTPALTPSVSTTSTSASPVTPMSHSPFVAPEPRFSSAAPRPSLISRHTTDVVPSVYRPAYRQLADNQRELTGLGVSARRPSSLYHPY